MIRLGGVAPVLTSPENPFHRNSWDVLDLRDVEWVTPFDTVTIAVEFHRALRSGRIPRVLPPRSPEVRSYLVALGFPQHVPDGWGHDDRVAVHPPLVPLMRLGHPYDWDDALDRTWPQARTALGSKEPADNLFQILGEVVDNAVTHGKSPEGAFVCAQFHTGTTTRLGPGIWVAVADTGVGIPAHLRRHPRWKDIGSDEELIGRARQPGVTGTSDRRGYGLFEAFEAATALGRGMVLIRSGMGEARFWLGDGRVETARYRRLQHPVRGTWVHFAMKA